jgi:hypothetical protein
MFYYLLWLARFFVFSWSINCWTWNLEYGGVANRDGRAGVHGVLLTGHLPNLAKAACLLCNCVVTLMKIYTKTSHMSIHSLLYKSCRGVVARHHCLFSVYSYSTDLYPSVDRWVNLRYLNLSACLPNLSATLLVLPKLP